MNNESLLEKIKSQYNLATIFDYIEDKRFKLKLAIYSNKLKFKLSLELCDYKIQYLLKSKVKVCEKYLSFYSMYNESMLENYDIDILNKNLKDDILKYKIDMDTFTKFIIIYLKKYVKKHKKKNNSLSIYDEIKIDINSPFIEDLFKKNNNLEEFLLIPIYVSLIEKFNLKNKYIKIFEKLNQSDSKYSSILFIFKNNTDIKYLKEFNINFKQIKKLYILEDKKNLNKNDNFNSLFDTFFSLDSLDNLKYLEISASNKEELNLSQNLTKFKSLEKLSLNYMNFKNNFLIKSNRLRDLSLSYSKNIQIDENTCLNLIKIKFRESTIIKHNNELLKFPKLEICELDSFQKNPYDLIIDFETLNNLKYLQATTSEFLKIQCSKLEEIYLKRPKENSFEIEKKTFKKLFDCKTLKYIDISLEYINDNQIAEIPGLNASVVKLKIFFENIKGEQNIYNLQNKFPNLTDINIFTELFIEENVKAFEMIPNPKCAINKISLFGNANIKLYIKSYEDLIEFKATYSGNILNLKESFPLFHDNCEIIFKSLIIFKFNYGNKNLDFIYNIYNNLDKMPNLKNFALSYYSENTDDIFFKKLIKKLLLMKLNEIRVRLSKKKFEFIPNKGRLLTINELIDICPNIKLKNLKNIYFEICD